MILRGRGAVMAPSLTKLYIHLYNLIPFIFHDQLQTGKMSMGSILGSSFNLFPSSRKVPTVSLLQLFIVHRVRHSCRVRIHAGYLLSSSLIRFQCQFVKVRTFLLLYSIDFLFDIYFSQNEFLIAEGNGCLSHIPWGV